MYYHRDITRILATHRCFISTRIYQARTTASHIIVLIIPIIIYGIFAYHGHTRISSLVWSYGSRCILHVLLFHVIPVFLLYACFPWLILLCPLLDIVSCYWYGYSRYWTWELLICDMWTPTSIVPVSCYIVPVILFPFPVILSTELRSSYHVTCIMYRICSCYMVYLKY